MKKLLGILVLGLLFCNVGFAGESIIKFNKCYDTSKFNSHNEYKNSNDNAFDEWSLEINLEKNTVTRTVIWKDSEVKKAVESGAKIRKHDIETFPIKSSTSKFIQMVDHDFQYTLDIESGELNMATPFGTNLKQKCKID